MNNDANFSRYTVYWRIQAQGAEIQTLKTKETFVRLGPLQSNTWFDFWVRAETRIGQGPSSPIETILAQNTGYTIEMGQNELKTCLEIKIYNPYISAGIVL